MMLHNDKFKEELLKLDYKTLRNQRQITYLNLACGFDIETTSTEHQGEKAAFMYIWMLGIGHGNSVFYGRTWDEFRKTTKTLTEVLDLHQTRRIIIYVHNLAYEFQFMRGHFSWLNVFATDVRKPLIAVTTGGIEFRDSLILSGYSLENTAKNLQKYKVKKLMGDLDYSKPRHHTTPLTDAELGYCKNDILVVTAYIQEQIELYDNMITKIPITNTGRVRKFTRDKCYYSSKDHKKTSRGKYYRYKQIMKSLTLEPDQYKQLKRGFMGGFTHANANYSGQVLENVSSIDFTSSYPSVMVSEKFPMTRFSPTEIVNSLDLLERGTHEAIITDVRFKNIRPTFKYENYISESKCFELKGQVINNGRVVKADLLAITLTEVDFEVIFNTYEWDSIAFSNSHSSIKSYLPKAIVESVLELYQKKTELKDVEGSEVEYMLSKGMLNSVYGMCVTDIMKDDVLYEDSLWGVENIEISEGVSNYNAQPHRFLFYPWGLWVTAYARRNLWTGIVAVGEDYVYSDTDSLKMLNYEKHKDYVEYFDELIINKMEAVLNYYNFDLALISPKSKTGKVKTLGIWDYEGTYTRFKTLGAKRYLVEDNGKLTLTVAGLSKQNGLNYMLEKCYNDNTAVFNLFDDGLYIPAESTGKMTHTYIDETLKFKFTDYLGNTEIVNPKSGIHLSNCEFTLTISHDYSKFLTNLKDGLLFKGVKIE